MKWQGLLNIMKRELIRRLKIEKENMQEKQNSPDKQ